MAFYIIYMGDFINIYFYRTSPSSLQPLPAHLQSLFAAKSKDVKRKNKLQKRSTGRPRNALSQ